MSCGCILLRPRGRQRSSDLQEQLLRGWRTRRAGWTHGNADAGGRRTCGDAALPWASHRLSLHQLCSLLGLLHAGEDNP